MLSSAPGDSNIGQVKRSVQQYLDGDDLVATLGLLSKELPYPTDEILRAVEDLHKDGKLRTEVVYSAVND